MNYSKIPLAQTVVTLCKTHNIKHIVISPGSRNAPLTIGFTHDDFFSCYSIVDERCAAFFAMGMAQQLQEPTAVVCTSGSALLNYFPAVSEAYYSRIPLVVLSADRPPHLVDIGDGQTIKQPNVFGEHSFYNADLLLDSREDSEQSKNLQKNIQHSNECEIHNALHAAIINSGPIHINIPFDEPLYERVEELSISPEPFKLPNLDSGSIDDDMEMFTDAWNSATRKMVLVGVLQPNSIEQDILNKIAEDKSVIILTETTSNLHHTDSFPAIDQLISPLNKEEFEALQPEVLLTLGGLIVSKRIKRFLRQYKPVHHYHVDKYNVNNTFFTSVKHIESHANSFFNAFLKHVKQVTSDYKENWLKIRNRRRQLHSKYLETISFSDFTVFNDVLGSVPANSQLQVGNSSAIRYTQLFELRKNITVFCNRGTSGIDGSTSTAIGASIIASERVTFVTGDLSFLYDSNALWNNYLKNDFRIIVINNTGGGIFRILPGHKSTENFDTFFETKHNLTAEYLCEMYNLHYCQAHNQEELTKELQTFYNSSERPRLLEIFTPDRVNDEVLLNYFDFIK